MSDSPATQLDVTFVRRARSPGSSRDLALLFAPHVQRAALTALFALQAEIFFAARASTDHAVSHARLEWWHAEIARLVEGKPAHPITRSLRECAARRTVDFRPLDELVSGAQWELARLTLESPKEFATAAWRTQGVIQWIGMQFASVIASEAHPFARELGVALALERALLTLPSAARSGSIPLPLSELNTRQITIDDLQEARPTPALSRYVAELCVAARQRLLETQLALSQPLSSALRAHIVLAALSDAQLTRIGRAADRTETLQQETSTLQRLWTAWRAARRNA